MAKEETKKCKKCMEEINKKAKKCPKCGANLGIPGFVKVLIVLAIIFGLCVSCMSSCTDAVNDSIEETENEYKDINGKTSFKVGESFENKHIKVTFVSSNLNYKDISKYATVKDGYKVVEFEFAFENVGKEDELASLYDFNCYADDAAMEQFYNIADENYEVLSATMSAGKTAKGKLYCEVPKDAETITIEYDASWLDNNNIEFIAK